MKVNKYNLELASTNNLAGRRRVEVSAHLFDFVISMFRVAIVQRMGNARLV